MKKLYRVTVVKDKIAVVIYHKSGKLAHQAFVEKSDVERLQPLFKRYMNRADVEQLSAEIEEAEI
jgi:hypothetical protein